MNENKFLKVSNLKTCFHTEEGLVKAVDGVSFDIEKGQIFALVGESGCGKSVTAFSIIGLIPQPPGEIKEGTIELEGQNLLALPEKEMRKIRGAYISMIFQEPMTSLNPVLTCGDQIVEAIRLHRDMNKNEARELAIEMIRKVGIPEPAQRYKEYPHQLSGGMRQRIMIAMALSCNPKLLIADEPTTALDVTIQAQILDLLREIRDNMDLSILLITHDLSVVAETADMVGVMYASKMVERTDVKSLFKKPLHPYTQGLFRSIPKLGERKAELDSIPGNVPNPLEFPAGCKFHDRCALAAALAKKSGSEIIETKDGKKVLKQCAEQEPELKEVEPGHWCACWKSEGYKE